MANRMVVVPEEVYESLLAQRNREKVLGDPIVNEANESSANVSRVLRDDKMGATEKFAAYDQELKRMRSLMRQKEERGTAPDLKSMLDQFVEQFGQIMGSLRHPASLPVQPQPVITQPPHDEKVAGMEQRRVLKANRTLKREAAEPPDYDPVRPPPTAPPSTSKTMSRQKQELATERKMLAAKDESSQTGGGIVRRRPSARALVERLLKRRRRY